MEQYKELCKRVLEEGTCNENRTDESAIKVPGEMIKVDVSKGFPILTLRNVPFFSAIAETSGFLHGVVNAEDFAKAGCKYWYKDANENTAWLNNPYRNGENDLGGIYGFQWRNWEGFKIVNLNSDNREKVEKHIIDSNYIQVSEGDNFKLYYKCIDQIKLALEKLMTNPNDRRILFHAWKPEAIDQMALPPCHILYNFITNVEKRELSICMYMRSTDIGLGLPSNIIGTAFILELFARIIGYKAKYVTIFMGDAHIYKDQVKGINELLERETLEQPTLVFDEIFDELFAKTVDGEIKTVSVEEAMNGIDNMFHAICNNREIIKLDNYKNHGELTNKFTMATETVNKVKKE